MARRAVLGLGLAAVGRPAYITTRRVADLGPDRSVESMRRRTWALLDAAVAAGVRHVDTARSYGRAEEFLAGWLDAHPGADVVVSSKWGYRYVGDWRPDADVHEVKDHSRTALAEQLAASRALLGDRLARYQVHSLTPESPALRDAGLLQDLARLRDGGLAVGCSVSGPAQGDVIRRALEVQVGGDRLFSSVQATWNLLETSAGPALAEAAEAGLVVLVKEAVANGRLVGDDAPAPLRAAARALGATPDAVALAAALAQPWAHLVLCGAVLVPQLEQNLRATRLAGSSLSAELTAPLAGLVEAPQAYWEARGRRAWH